jgi:hypothetical protein
MKIKNFELILLTSFRVFLKNSGLSTLEVSEIIKFTISLKIIKIEILVKILTAVSLLISKRLS